MALRFVLATSLIFMATPVFAAPPEVQTVVRQMKEALEPARSSIREVAITVSDQDAQKASWTARQARKQQANGKWTLLEVLTPETTKGNALLIWERQDGPNTQWWYPPALRRVRELVPVETYQRFLDSDLTYADLGFVDRQGTYRLLGEEPFQGKQVYKMEFVPARDILYSRLITWVDPATMLPLRRDYDDVAGKLWKTMTFDQVETIDGIPTPLHIRMQDLQQGSHTDITYQNVRYDVDIPDSVFDPQQLPLTVEARWWEPSEKQVAAGQ